MTKDSPEPSVEDLHLLLRADETIIKRLNDMVVKSEAELAECRGQIEWLDRKHTQALDEIARLKKSCRQ